MSNYVKNPTNLQRMRRENYEIINGLQVVTYRNGAGDLVSIVRTGKTYHGTLLFESPSYEVCKTFAVVYPSLVGREFVYVDKTIHRAFFNKEFPTHLFGSEQYDEYRGKLVRFTERIGEEPLGFIRIK